MKIDICCKYHYIYYILFPSIFLHIDEYSVTCNYLYSLSCWYCFIYCFKPNQQIRNISFMKEVFNMRKGSYERKKIFIFSLKRNSSTFYKKI